MVHIVACQRWYLTKRVQVPPGPPLSCRIRSMPKFCPHCSSGGRRVTHSASHAHYYLEIITRPFSLLFRAVMGEKRDALYKLVWDFALDALLLFRIARLRQDFDAVSFFNRSRIFLDEAHRRGIEIAAIEVCGRVTDEFRFVFHGKRYYYESIPLLARSLDPEIDDKYAVKKILQKHKIPVPEGRRFTSARKIFRYAKNIGYPLVVKPVRGSLSRHATYPVLSDGELTSAISLAKHYAPDILVERYVHGEFYRATVIGGKDVFVCNKKPAHVIGDGASTIRTLIESKNEHPFRGDPGNRSYTLHKIAIDTTVIQRLADQGLTLDSVPEIGTVVHLNKLVTLVSGADVIGCTSVTHPANRLLFTTIARIFGSPLIGIDFICQDITIPYTEQETAVLELNSKPYIDMHAYPSEGEADPAALRVWDMVEEMTSRS